MCAKRNIHLGRIECKINIWERCRQNLYFKAALHCLVGKVAEREKQHDYRIKIIQGMCTVYKIGYPVEAKTKPTQQLLTVYKKCGITQSS